MSKLTQAQLKLAHKAEFVKQFHRLRTAVLAVLTKATEATTDSEVSDVLCGPSLYTCTYLCMVPEYVLYS